METPGFIRGVLLYAFQFFFLFNKSISQKIRKTYSMQIVEIERLKIISKNKPIHKYIVKSISRYLRAMSSFVSKMILCF